MPAGGENVIVGQYAVTYGGVTVGMMEGEQGVPTLIQRAKSLPIDNTDRYGKTTIDVIHLGVDYLCQYTCMEYRPGSLSAFAPWGTFGVIGVIGVQHFNIAAPLILTSIAGVTAFDAPLTFTAAKAILAPNFEGRLLFGPMVRTVPISQSLLPYVPGVGLPVVSFIMAI